MWSNAKGMPASYVVEEYGRPVRARTADLYRADRWEFLWWDSEPTGVRVRRKAVIGTVQQYPNLENAWQASNGLRVSINETRNRQREQAVTVADLVDHYSRMELANDQFDLRHEDDLQRFVAIARQRPRRNLCPWIQFSPPNFGPGNNTALTVNPTIGCSRALAPRARTLIGHISFYLASSGLAAMRAGIQKHVGWHTFRRSFSTILIANGENVKVVQELMRHSNCRCTLEIYSQARIQSKRDAQHRVIQLIVPWKGGATEAPEP